MKDQPYSTGIFETITGVHFSDRRVYVIITGAGNDYASADGQPGVPVLDVGSTETTHGTVVLATRQGPGPQSPFMTGTLIECSSDAGEEFATLVSKLVGGPGGEGGGQGSTLIAVMVYPKTKEVRTSWWDYARGYQGVANPIPIVDALQSAGPFLSIASFRAYDPCVVNFKIRFEPHLLSPSTTKDKMVQAYPTSGAHLGHGGNNEPVSVTGWTYDVYRLDKDGTGQIYLTPPEWQPIHVDSATAFGFGLLFNTDPPLINADKLAL